MSSSRQGSAAPLAELLQPLLPQHLGVLAIAYNAADAPARPSLAASLLRQNFDLNISDDSLQAVFQRILRNFPGLIAVRTGPEACLQPAARGAPRILRTVQYIPAHWQGNCHIDDGVLERWKTYPTSCFTLARGRLEGQVLLLKCRLCGAVYGGPWCWTHGWQRQSFPEGCHRPRAATSFERLEDARWFFAVPQICFETDLLKFCLLLGARGGVSWTAFFVVYTALFGSTFSGSFMANRSHFVTALEMAASWSKSIQGFPLFVTPLVCTYLLDVPHAPCR